MCNLHGNLSGITNASLNNSIKSVLKVYDSLLQKKNRKMYECEFNNSIVTRKIMNNAEFPVLIPPSSFPSFFPFRQLNNKHIN